MSAFDTVVAVLKKCGQEHILEAIPNLNEEHPIFVQLRELNIERSLGHFTSASGCTAKSLDRFAPVSNVTDLTKCELMHKSEFERIGRDAIQRGTTAAVIMSGGQGTRLGYHGPKGMYNLGMPSQKCIFRLHIEKITKIRDLNKLADGSLPSVPIYIMTSNLNHHIIETYFRDNLFFGYPEQDVVFFEQGVEPSFTFDGKIIIESATSLSLAPDGNGGIYRALQYAGCIDDMHRRGVEHLHIYGIDNVLTKSLDPQFLGACIQQQAECGNKVVWRAHKTEKVGVTAELNGRMHVLEYSELPADLADSEDSSGKLLFGAANICNHYLTVQFLVDKVLPSLSEVYHVAKKKIPFFDPLTGHTVTPTEVNGIKMEMFIFDVFPLATKWVVVEGLREDEFAPVKNAPGSPQVLFGYILIILLFIIVYIAK